MRRGDVWLANLNPTRGAEAGKVRPVLIIRADFLIAQNDPTIRLTFEASRNLPKAKERRIPA
jgi:mRNA interferase MazF